ncbi:MAG: gliding motility-associated C-terminal domain-containing protein [Bacteroidota bacterium]
MFCGPFTGPDFDASVDEWSTPTFGTPDLFSTSINPSCWNFQTNSTYPGPEGLPGMQAPRTGDVMAGLRTRTDFGAEEREYIQVELDEPLSAGCHYRVAYYVSLADSFEFATNNIGAAFTVNAITLGTDSILPVAPQVNANGIVQEATGWTLVEDTIVASNNFRFLTIGNFFSDENTDTIANPNASQALGTNGGYYFIDDIDVRQICPSFGMEDGTVCLGDTLPLVPQLPSCVTGESYLWTTGETTNSIEVMDQGFYGVQISFDTCVIGDTIFVDLNFCPPTINMANVFSPNGDGINDDFRPVSFSRIDDAVLSIYDRWGNLMFVTENLNNGWNGRNADGDEVPAGVYYWTITTRGRNQEMTRQSGDLTLIR